jgi:hypothetical protein
MEFEISKECPEAEYRLVISPSGKIKCEKVVLNDQLTDSTEGIAIFLAHEFGHALHRDHNYTILPGETWVLNKEPFTHYAILRRLIREKRAWDYTLSLFPSAHFTDWLKGYQQWATYQLQRPINFKPPRKPSIQQQQRYAAFILSHEEALLNSQIGKGYRESTLALLERARNVLNAEQNNEPN